LQDLFSQIDADGNGQISKSEFENALGAGGTNVAQADDVFDKLDQNGDGSVSPDEMKSALQGAGGHHGGHHHHAHAASSDGTSDQTSADGTSNTDPLLQALNAQTTSTSLTGTTSPYDLFDQLMQRQAQSFSSATSAALSV
jgi:Ca2+-binding EF-hand superfamily protein